MFFFLMIRRPPRSTRTDTLFPYTTLFRGTQEDVFRGVTASASKAIGATPVNRATVAAGRARPRGRKRLAASGILSTNPVDNTVVIAALPEARRSEEHTSELQSLMRISYAVFCLKKKNIRL